MLALHPQGPSFSNDTRLRLLCTISRYRFMYGGPLRPSCPARDQDHTTGTDSFSLVFPEMLELSQRGPRRCPSRRRRASQLLKPAWLVRGHRTFFRFEQIAAMIPSLPLFSTVSYPNQTTREKEEPRSRASTEGASPPCFQPNRVKICAII